MRPLQGKVTLLLQRPAKNGRSSSARTRCRLGETLAEARTRIVAAGYARVEYLELRADGNLTQMSEFDRPARLLAAAWLGETRLIDNVEVFAQRSPPGS